MSDIAKSGPEDRKAVDFASLHTLEARREQAALHAEEERLAAERARKAVTFAELHTPEAPREQADLQAEEEKRVAEKVNVVATFFAEVEEENERHDLEDELAAMEEAYQNSMVPEHDDVPAPQEEPEVQMSDPDAVIAEGEGEAAAATAAVIAATAAAHAAKRHNQSRPGILSRLLGRHKEPIVPQALKIFEAKFGPVPDKPEGWPPFMAWPNQMHMRRLYEENATPEKVAAYFDSMREMAKGIPNRAEAFRARGAGGKMTKDASKGVCWAILLSSDRPHASIASIIGSFDSNPKRDRIATQDGGLIEATPDGLSINILRASAQTIELLVREKIARGEEPIKLTAGAEAAAIIQRVLRSEGIRGEITLTQRQDGSFFAKRPMLRIEPHPFGDNSNDPAIAISQMEEAEKLAKKKPAALTPEQVLNGHSADVDPQGEALRNQPVEDDEINDPFDDDAPQAGRRRTVADDPSIRMM